MRFEPNHTPQIATYSIFVSSISASSVKSALLASTENVPDDENNHIIVKRNDRSTTASLADYIYHNLRIDPVLEHFVKRVRRSIILRPLFTYRRFKKQDHFDVNENGPVPDISSRNKHHRHRRFSSSEDTQTAFTFFDRNAATSSRSRPKRTFLHRPLFVYRRFHNNTGRNVPVRGDNNFYPIRKQLLTRVRRSFIPRPSFTYRRFKKHDHSDDRKNGPVAAISKCNLDHRCRRNSNTSDSLTAVASIHLIVATLN